MTRTSFLPLGAAVLLTMILSSTALAHKVRIFAWEDRGMIQTEAKFSGGNPAKNATITIVDADTGQELLSGTTDQNGLFGFPRPKSSSGKLDIIVSGGDGHKNHWLHTLEDASQPSVTPPQQPVLPAQQPTRPAQAVAGSGSEVLPPLTREELQHLLDTTIDRQLAPIRKTLAENTEHGPTLQDILGGIGYLLGLAGIAAYMQALKKKKE